MTISIFLILILLLILIVYLEARKFFVNRQLKNFTLIKGATFIGVIKRIWGTNVFDEIDMFMKFFDEAKSSAIRFWLGPVLVLGIYDPLNVETILTHESALNKPFVYEYFHCKTSILTVDKNTWKPHRRALNSVFTISVLLNYLPQINDKSRTLISRIQPFLYGDGHDLHRLISTCCIDIAVQTLFGINWSLQSERGDRIFEIKRNFLNCIDYRIPRIWFRYDFVYHNFSKVGRKERCLTKYLSDLFEQVYYQKVEQLQRIDDQSVNNLLEKCLQLEREGIYSRKNVMDELKVFFFAGVDTPSTVIFATLLMLAINQRHQELVIDELRSIFESADCDVTQTHLTAMNYTEPVIKESMRLLPPTPFISRQTTAEIELPNGTLPKGTTVLISIMHMHRNPQVWGENVLEFDPDRFLPENIQKRPPFSYIPFSAGQRNCIGMKHAMMEVKTVLAHLLRQYKFTTYLKFNKIQIYNSASLEDIFIDKPLKIEKRNFQS